MIQYVLICHDNSTIIVSKLCRLNCVNGLNCFKSVHNCVKWWTLRQNGTNANSTTFEMTAIIHTSPRVLLRCRYRRFASYTRRGIWWCAIVDEHKKLSKCIYKYIYSAQTSTGQRDWCMRRAPLIWCYVTKHNSIHSLISSYALRNAYRRIRPPRCARTSDSILAENV